MSRVVVIRRYTEPDDSACHEVLRLAAMSTIWPAFWATLTRETFFEVIVVLAAILFIFGQLPPVLCLLAAPGGAIIIFLFIYLGHWVKANSVNAENIEQLYFGTKSCFWVAEIFENEHNQHAPITILNNYKNKKLAGKVIGTVAVVPSIRSEFGVNSGWMRRLAVHPDYKRGGIATALVDTVLNFCRTNRFQSVELVTTECHAEARELYLKKGFELRQLYHRQIIPYFVHILMYEFTYNLVL